MATVLVVDDEESMAWAVTYWLRTAGHTPIVAATGAAALQAAGAHPDLILLDLGLPDLPGAEVLRRLKAQPETARIPVVIVSGQPDAAALVADSGARAVAAILRKPLQFPELCAVLVAVLDAPGDWAEPPGPPPPRVQLIYRLVTEGSNALVRQVCLRLDADRTPHWGTPPAALPDWADLARLARREGLLSTAEGALLTAESAVLVEAR
jgi:two-component system KDP operon response regulator KdpE